MEEKLQSFTEYCKHHPEHRFWQALRNWAQAEEAEDIGYILIATGVDMYTGNYENVEDTFHWRD